MRPLIKLFKSDTLKIALVCGFTIFTAYFSASYSIAPNAGPNMAEGATGASGTGSFNGHTLFTGAAPAISNCGTSPTITSASGDNAGTVTVGISPKNNLGQEIPVLQCTITWATAFTTAPAFTVTMANNSTRRYGVGGLNVSIAANSTTVTVLNFDTNAGSATFSYTAF